MSKQELKNATAFYTDPETGEEIQRHPTLDANGAEIPDPVPLAPPVNYQKPFDMFAHIQQLVAGEHLRLAAIQAGDETFEEADDFEIGDDFDPTTPYEEHFDPVGEGVRDKLRQADYRAKVRAAYAKIEPMELKDANPDYTVDEGREVSVKGSATRASGKSQSVGRKDQKAGVQNSVPEGSDSNPLDD